MSPRRALQPLQRLPFLARFLQMPHRPPFLHRAMNLTGGRRLNPVFSKGLRKPFAPPSRGNCTGPARGREGPARLPHLLGITLCANRVLRERHHEP